MKWCADWSASGRLTCLTNMWIYVHEESWSKPLRCEYDIKHGFSLDKVFLISLGCNDELYSSRMCCFRIPKLVSCIMFQI